MKKLFLLSAFVLLLSSVVFTSCSKDKKERVTIAEDKILGKWTGDYSTNGTIAITFSKGNPNYSFRGTISVINGDVTSEYEKFEGYYNLLGNTLKLYVTKVSRKDDEGWNTMEYNEWVNVALTFVDDNTVNARWGKSMTASVKR